jgi:hypothetical protein
MKEKLLEKFNGFALSSAIGLQTNYRTTVIDDLADDEVETLYYRFFPKPQVMEILALQQEKLRLRDLQAIILKDAQYIGLHDPQDFTSLNNFMKNRSPLKKVLPFYKIHEFDELIKQFKSLRSKYEREAKIPYTKAWYHKNKLPMPSQN